MSALGPGYRSLRSRFRDDKKSNVAPASEPGSRSEHVGTGFWIPGLDPGRQARNDWDEQQEMTGTTSKK